MYQHVRPSHLERHLLGVFLLPSADQVLDTSHITGRLPTAALRKPGDVHSCLARERVPAAHRSSSPVSGGGL